jgi:predicted Zn-dependent peptidase
VELGDLTAPFVADQAIQPTSRIVLVDMPGAEQTSIRVLVPAYESGDEREIASDLAGIVMGGTFTSRLNAKLREEKGYTYGAGCSFSGGYYGNHLSVRTNVQTKATVEAIQDLSAVLATANDGFSADDHSKALSAYRGDYIQMSASRKQLASEMVDLFRLGDPADLWATDLTTSQAVTPEQMHATAELFDTTRGVTVLVGDASVVEPMLQEAGIEYEKALIPE